MGLIICQAVGRTTCRLPGDCGPSPACVAHSGWDTVLALHANSCCKSRRMNKNASLDKGHLDGGQQGLDQLHFSLTSCKEHFSVLKVLCCPWHLVSVVFYPHPCPLPGTSQAAKCIHLGAQSPLWLGVRWDGRENSETSRLRTGDPVSGDW